MHAVIRRYIAGQNVVDEARPKLEQLARTMRETPGFGAYYLLRTPDGLATITVTEDESGTSESMGRAAQWVRENLQTGASLGAPEVTVGEILMNTDRAGAVGLRAVLREALSDLGQAISERHDTRPPEEILTHAVIRKYRASQDVIDEAQPKLEQLARTMRETPGLVAYYLLRTRDGLASITVTEDESGASESMGRAADWVRQNLQRRASLSEPEVTVGEILMNTDREGAVGLRAALLEQALSERYATHPPASALRADGSTDCRVGYPVKGNSDSGLYHTPESPVYGQTIPEFCFTSASAAEAAGFRAPAY
jgi:quinol monooxygenase YgiN